MVRRTPSGKPWNARNLRANSTARAASGPLAVSPAPCPASSRREGQGIAAPSPPKWRPRRPPRSSTPKWSRAGASTKTLLRLDILGQQGHGLLLPRPGGLVHDNLEPGVFIANLLGRQEVGPSGENGRFEDGVPGTVEPEKLPVDSAMYNARFDPGPWGRSIDRQNFELAPGTCCLQHRALNHLRRDPGKLRARNGPLCKEHGVIRQVNDRGPAGAHVPESTGLEKRLQHNHLLPPLDSHRSKV